MVERKPKKRKLIHRLRSKFRLTILNETTFAELFSTSLKPMNVIIIFGVLLVVFGTLIYTLVAFTPLKYYVIPDMTDYEYRRQAREAGIQVDSMLAVQNQQARYLTDLHTVLTGGIIRNPVDDSAQVRTEDVQLNYSLTEEEKALRERLAKEDRYSLEAGSGSADETGYSLFKPLEGTVSAVFNPKKLHFGIDLVAPRDAVVKCALDGTVLLASFTSDGGNVIMVQHANNLVSVYKHNSVLFKKPGDLVRAGESLAVIGESGEESDGPHLHFELWQNGIPVDPLQYLAFEK